MNDPLSLDTTPVLDCRPLRNQERLWLHQTREPDSVRYNLCYRIRMDLAPPVAVLQAALTRLLTSWPSLRTTFHLVGGQLVRRITAQVSVDLPVRKLPSPSDAAPVAVQSALDQALTALACRPFDPAVGPLFRMELLTFGTSATLVLVLHHLIHDASSAHLLLCDLETITRGILAEQQGAAQQGLEAASSRSGVIQDAEDAMRAEQGWLTSSAAEAARQWLGGRLKDVPVLRLPTDRPLPVKADEKGGVVKFRLPAALSERLTRLTSTLGISRHSVLMSALAILMGRYTGQQDFVLGTLVDLRPAHPNGRRANGCLVNTLAIRFELTEEESFEALLKRQTALLRRDLSHRQLPYEEQVRLAGGQPRGYLDPLIQVAFGYDGVSDPLDAHAHYRWRMERMLEDAGPPDAAKFDFYLLIRPTEQGEVGQLTFSTLLFDPWRAEQLVRHYLQLLDCLLLAPARPLREQTFLTVEELRQLTELWPLQTEFPSSRLSLPGQRTLDRAFEAQAERSPDAIALRFGTQSLSYRALNRLATQVASRLQQDGLQTGEAVGVWLERSLESVVAILAVLKAGATYVPIDPQTPRERVAGMCQDAELRWLLCDRTTLVQVGGTSSGASAAAPLGPSPLCLMLVSTGTNEARWEDPRLASAPAALPSDRQAPPDGQRTAYIIFTSGSTGRPKGARVSHANVVRLFASTESWFHFGPQDVWTLFHSLAFDFSVWELWGALLYGGTLVIVPYAVSRTPKDFYALLAEEKVTVLNQTPSAFRQLMREDARMPSSAPFSSGSSPALALRQVIFGGEALDLPSLKPWFDRHGDQAPQLVNMYGITETTVHVTWRPLVHADSLASSSRIGRPLPDLQTCVLDGEGRLVPPGIPGELYVGGAGVCQGYLNRPELTASRFIPAESLPGLCHGSPALRAARLYRTGDLVRLMPVQTPAAGQSLGETPFELEYLGRIDTQVKLRGFRIELGELDATLQGHPQVAEAAVLRVGDTAETHRLVAWVVPHSKGEVPTDGLEGSSDAGPASGSALPGAPTLPGALTLPGASSTPSTLISVAYDQGLTEARLRTWMQERLPEYMVPSAFILLPSMPLTRNGKRDTQALLLRWAEAGRRLNTEGYRPPETPQQALLVQIWEDVLDRAPIGIDDSFFAVGGDSIRSLEVLARAHTRGLPLRLEQLFTLKTVRALSANLGPGPLQPASAEQTVEPATPLAPAPFCLIPASDRLLLPEGVVDAYPLSALQLGMFYHTRLEPSSSLYHDLFSHQVRARFDLARLQQALHYLVACHPVLRTAFVMGSFSRPLQLVYAQAELPLQVTDLQGSSEAEASRALERWIQEERTASFDWSTPPLMRAQVHLWAPDRFTLSFSFHHAILDGWSNARLITDLMRTYGELLAGATPSLTPPSGTYREYVALELAASRHDESRRFWLTRLEDAPLLTLPRWQDPAAAPVAESARGAMQSLHFSRAQVMGIQQVARRLGVPLKSVLLAVHLRTVAFFYNEPEVTIGLLTNGRSEHTRDDTLGLFLNTVPFRMAMPGGTWEALIQQVFSDECALLPHRRYPLPEIQKALGGRNFFDIGFNFVHFHVLQSASNVGGVALEGARVVEQANYPLVAIFGLDPYAESLQLELLYDRRVLSDVQISALLGYYTRAFDALLAQPEGRYDGLDLLSEAEQAQLFALNTRGNDGQGLLPLETRTVVSLFEQQVLERHTESGSAPAVAHEEQGMLTFEALNARANRLARLLLEEGLEPGFRVGVSLERSLDWVVSIWAIWKAGAVYVPLDPGYPRDRLGLMIQETRPYRLLTSTRLASRLADEGVAMLLVETLDERLAGFPDGNLNRCLELDQEAYIIYTSGTTGRPKGVLVPHRGLGNLVRVQGHRQPIGPGDCLLQLASPNFDASISDILVALCNGARLQLCTEEALLTASGIIRHLEQYAITHANLPPSLLAVLPERPLPQLRTLKAAGEACTPALVKRWGLGRRFVNGYGPTEVTVGAALGLVTQEDAANQEIPIGVPFDHYQLYILNAQQKLVPPGAIGELHVGGIGVAHGYLHRPELTAERFIPNPFGPGRLYRTGDLGRWRPDGRLDFVGRRDNQVKVRGHRVQLEEIKGLLDDLPDVQESAVIVRDDPGGQPQLVAYVTAQTERAPVELWPSVAEFFIFDETLYMAMINDERRMRAYSEAITREVPGKVVMDIGTGRFAVMAILCARAGARKVYAIELSEETAGMARARVESLGLSAVIEVICGDASTLTLPEQMDVCVSALVGHIAGAEGVVAILNGARRLLKPGGVMIPRLATTRLAAATLPDEVLRRPRFTALSGRYTSAIFQSVQKPFDLRVCVRNVSARHRLSSVASLEELDFSGTIPLEDTHTIRLRFERAGRFDGFFAWLHLDTGARETLDALEQSLCWLPVFIPVFDPGLTVAPGDELEATIRRTLADGLHPDFHIQGQLTRGRATPIPFACDSCTISAHYQGSPFYQRLFAERGDGMDEHLQSRPTAGRPHEDTVQDLTRSAAPGSSSSLALTTPDADGWARSLRTLLQQRLPDYMVPSRIVILKRMPKTLNGKLDLKGLPAPDVHAAASPLSALPTNALEQWISNLWSEVLRISQIGLDQNFFDLGGHSLQLMQIHGRLEVFLRARVEILDLFENPTVRRLSQHLLQKGLIPQDIQHSVLGLASDGPARPRTHEAVEDHDGIQAGLPGSPPGLAAQERPQGRDQRRQLRQQRRPPQG